MTTPVWTRNRHEDILDVLKRLEDLRQRERDVWQDQKNHGIIWNPLNPDQIAVANPIPPRIVDAPNTNADALDNAMKQMEELREKQRKLFDGFESRWATSPWSPPHWRLPITFPLPPRPIPFPVADVPFQVRSPQRARRTTRIPVPA